jgi:Arc/MetJ family transcription regulator
MSKRLQVVMSREEYGEIREAAERRRVTVSQWVRRALREAREQELSARPAMIRETHSQYGESEPPFPRRVQVEMGVREDLLEAVRGRYHLPNWRAAVELALRRVAIEPMTKQEALAMQGVGWEGDLDQIRSGDPGDTW